MSALELTGDEDWRDYASCQGLDADLFFPGQGDVDTARAAKAVCATCPVTEQCLAIADPEFGIFGGLTVKERRRRRRDHGVSRARRPRVDEFLDVRVLTPNGERMRRYRAAKAQREAM